MSQGNGRMTRREVVQLAAAGAAAVALDGPRAVAQTTQYANDRVIICNEDSNTLTLIDPANNTVAGAINLTSFDEDPRPPFRFVTGGVMPTHSAMVHKPLYHGAISIHGAVPSPDSSLIATTGRGSSNLYLIDASSWTVIGNQPNPRARPETSPEQLTSGVFIGREPHEPTFTRNGKEIWATVRGEDKIAVLDLEKALFEAKGGKPGTAIRTYVPTVLGPAHCWFSADGRVAVAISQKAPQIDIFDVSYDAAGLSSATRRMRLDISAHDKFGFSPFLKLAADGTEMWISHKLADAVSVIDMKSPERVVETIPLGELARPNHVDFVDNARGRVVYVSLARVDDNGPGGVAASRIAIVDRTAAIGQRRVIGHFFSHGREAHGLWTNPEATRLYVAHEQDELPNTPNAGQTVCSVFDISEPTKPVFITQIPLGDLSLPSGKLRNKKSINLVYVRPGARSATA